ncbi:hypothetical protein B4U80_13273 [Leptotrombidium deliense]|uniref:Tetraspanin n=1 Tax=Leptotrombidium deliense TaxID=299467 RepID=A0A443S963_9ACAR|nr:hypothetical protein B4U80_13273 [Leptotrombidium deliense]
MSSGSVRCFKYTLGIFNFIVLIFGILLIVYGAKNLKHPSSISKVVKTPEGSSKGCIALGVMILGISFLGCCGAFRENQCMLITFSLIMLIFVVIELILGCALLAYKKEFKKLAKNGLEKMMKKYDSGKKNSTSTIVVDEIQKTFHCCGINDANDWVSWKKPIPTSCCHTDKNATVSTCTEQEAWHKGCLKPINYLISKAYAALGAVTITVAVIQSLGITFACCVAYAVHRDYKMV